jgi:uncharacterized OB-fold protein
MLIKKIPPIIPSKRHKKEFRKKYCDRCGEVYITPKKWSVICPKCDTRKGHKLR